LISSAAFFSLAIGCPVDLRPFTGEAAGDKDNSVVTPRTRLDDVDLVDTRGQVAGLDGIGRGQHGDVSSVSTSRKRTRTRSSMLEA
jgi:hypothetical protein